MAKKLQRKEKLIDRNKLKLIILFLLRFNILAIPLYAIIYLNLSFEPLQALIAQITGALLKLLGYGIVQNNHTITTSIGNVIQNIEVSFDSTGWKSLYALIALALAVPRINLYEKLKFLIVGLPILFALNILRILTTILVALEFGLQYFDMVHLFLWREGLIIAVVVLWYLWLRKENYNIRLK